MLIPLHRDDATEALKRGMTLVDYLRSAEAGLDGLLCDLERLVRLESPSSDLDALMRSADLVEQIGISYLDTEPERIVRDDKPHLRWRLGHGPRKILIVCHHDTVWPIGSWGEDPWTNADGVIRGPGSFDMKTGILQAFLALKILQNTDGVTVLITADEEIGSPSSRELIEDEARECRAAFVLEASGPEGALKTERKGASMYNVHIIGKAAHAGLEPEKGANAGIELAHQILKIAELANLGLGTTVTPTVLTAGTTTNTVPARASISVDVRVCTIDEQQRVEHDMQRLTPVLAGTSLQIDGGPNRPPLESRSAMSLFTRAQELGAIANLPEVTSIAVGGASDGNFTAGVGTATLDGLGAVGGGAHAEDEHVLVSQIPARTALLALLIADQLHD